MNASEFEARVRVFLGEKSRNTWSQEDMIRICQMSVDELASFGILDSGAGQTSDGDGTTQTFDLPEDLIYLGKITVGDYEYKMARPHNEYYHHVQYVDQYIAIVDEEAWTCKFYAAPASGNTITWYGKLRHPEITDSNTELLYDSRYHNALTYFGVSTALMKTEDDYRPFETRFLAEMARFGHMAKLVMKVNYRDVQKKNWRSI